MAFYGNIDKELVTFLEDKAHTIRVNLLNFIYRIGMGHLGGELSMVDMAVALYYKYLNYDVMNPFDPKRDRFLLSKGHCSETLFTIFAEQGAYTYDYMVEHFETLKTAKFGMHSNRKYVDQIEVSAGSLGHGLPIAVGYALGARKQKAGYRVYVLVGDGELEEGTNWEAMMAAGHHELGNLTLIVDKNGLQMTGPTREVMNIDPLDRKIEAFGWDVNVIDGNNMYECCAALQQQPPPDPIARRRPYAIIMNTTKGKGVSFMENNVKWHGGGIAEEQLKEALASLEAKRKTW